MRLLSKMSSCPGAFLLHCIKLVVGIKLISAPELKASEFILFTVLLASVAVCAGALMRVRTALAPPNAPSESRDPGEMLSCSVSIQALLINFSVVNS